MAAMILGSFGVGASIPYMKHGHEDHAVPISSICHAKHTGKGMSAQTSSSKASVHC